MPGRPILIGHLSSSRVLSGASVTWSLAVLPSTSNSFNAVDAFTWFVALLEAPGGRIVFRASPSKPWLYQSPYMASCLMLDPLVPTFSGKATSAASSSSAIAFASSSLRCACWAAGTAVSRGCASTALCALSTVARLQPMSLSVLMACATIYVALPRTAKL